MTTSGNSDTHVILRGGRSGPNYSASHVAKALDLVAAAGLPRRLMVDASHGNSGKDYRRQPAVAEALAEQITAGERGITGVMLESFLVAGRQDPGNPAALTYGQSVTDACMDIEMTTATLETLASAVARRRHFSAELSGTKTSDSLLSRGAKPPRGPNGGQPVPQTPLTPCRGLPAPHAPLPRAGGYPLPIPTGATGRGAGWRWRRRSGLAAGRSRSSRRTGRRS